MPRRSGWCWGCCRSRRDPSAGERSCVFVHIAVRHAAELRRSPRAGQWGDETGCLCRTSVRVRQPAQGPGEDSLLGCVTNVSENLQSCTEDGRRPPRVDFQELAPNPGAAAFKGRGGERPRKRRLKGRRVSVEKMSESEPIGGRSSRLKLWLPRNA